MDEIAGHANGALWAFRFADGCGEAMDDARDGAHPGQWRWLHFPLSDNRARRYLEQFEGLPEAARALLLHPEERVQVRFEARWTFGVLPDLERDLTGQIGDPGRLVFALDGGHMITARRRSLRVIDDVRREIETGAPLSEPGAGFERLVERFLEISQERLDLWSDQLDAIEDRVLSEAARMTPPGLGSARRGLSRTHREFQALRTALTRALGQRGGRAEHPVSARLPDLIARLEDYDRETASLQDRARLLHEEADTNITNATNRNLRLLTIFSTLMMPPTVLVGAFGMNLQGMPFAQDGAGFWAACALCAAGVAGGFLLLRRFGILE